ncbi:Ac145 [Cnaphalocrocis medinalis granulovirus]|uniref:Ac145 n=1 Tax=Cnaphalocrocis medinalis granulovirus TaxID=1750712 RepID=A0A109WZR2_9BBAC|nr:Ac145 [Cnaphalocrocis medinalis granulovirus]AMF83760.1 Ac145 [Cnaphalocrocis medinalis granulovirus]WPN08640.1 Ac145 [Cnaphalocrocis medinalis granulovirus]
MMESSWFVFNFSTLLFIIFIIIKVIIYYNIKNLQKQTWFLKQICDNNFYGKVIDPFDCNSYYECPIGTKYYCPSNMEFDADNGTCTPLDPNNPHSCNNVTTRRLLLQ